ncbi:hypothetical protein GPECTOR_2g993 [Gonium pectorale]|uniref:Reverse transcriptase domain-containing protein n=1 Tax=Gonium pectorale TaxID=33097 RepID=A0A150H1Y5_GONPE|nr:hypothetical protein GPECTOR_2g993 [Gonium pectorale]|eukprot:KXZ56111.1 hypothetical protein GPECTOR_2g993 [Gonium pectorale]
MRHASAATGYPDVAALRDAAGRLVTDPARLPDVVAGFWESVCQPPPLPSPSERTAVLAALSVQSRLLPPERLEALGDPSVSVAEVDRALSQAKPGTSPGWDGIPVDLLRAFRAELAPALARLFSAIGNLKQPPAGFLKGVISVIFKGRGADRTAPGSYRPITLLCTDSRLLARVLANRLSPCLSTAIPLEQSAFLPGRSIGANTRFLRCLPHLLQQQQRSAIVAFLDFAKAYDTIDRSVLFALMERMGVGPGFLAWAQLLLMDTLAVASVNGYLSRVVRLHAGVRQGCPLAPLLYLFVAYALLCWLQERGVGVGLGGDASATRVTASQFADDTQVTLNSADEVPGFLELMAVFARASRQHLNPTKVKLLPVGRQPPVDGPAPPEADAVLDGVLAQTAKVVDRCLGPDDSGR